ncbi:MAG: HD domain-containing protein [Lachnospiraceae bacterium]|nr:HD domain-containing protein [Lachnospiraceae bacterium]
MDLIKKRRNITTLLLCVAGVLINTLLSTVVTVFELPLYLDTVGTVAVAVMGGYLPGIVVGFATNIIKAITDPSSMYYGVLNVLIAYTASFMAERKLHRKIHGALLMVLAFTLIGGGLGAIIPWYMEGLSFDSEALSGIIYETGLFGSGVSHILSSLIMDLPDKAVTVLLALGIVHIIPEKYYKLFSFKLWLQNVPEDDEYRRKEFSDIRKISLRIKALIVIAFALSSTGLVCTALGARTFRKILTQENTHLAEETANLAASVIDGDRVDEYLRKKGDMEDYRETKQLLEKILSRSPEVDYLYVYKIEEDGCHVVFDIDTDKAPAAETGSVIPFDEGFADQIPELLEGKEVEPVITNDKYGYLLTFYQPVYDSEGRCVCYAAADAAMEKLNTYERSYLTEIISVFSGFFIILCTVVVWLVDYHLIIPINSFADSMDRISSVSDTQEQMDENVKIFRSLGIHTGDELEKLFLSVCRMTRNQAEQMRSIRRLSDSTAKMQDGLIITMADLVESRDSDTGAHVPKTAAYVKIIAEGLKKKGYYIQKLTPKFMSDVVRSAPLHDIGKINIPDAVLDKPGKLTDEEYEIMKTHTTAGRRIMENAINTVDGDNYLKEARNMASYHHERWDGKGYPEGIHGEVIPLSARIMAVADVFDALTSPRVYKPAFPLEKALAILEEGKGTQFDPKCVEVFMDALPEIKVILRKYNKEA